MEKQKIKDTNLGKWMADKAPAVLGVVGELLPDKGALGIVKNLLHKEPEVKNEDADAIVEAEIQYQDAVTRRWEADMGSDVKLAKLIRPVTLICLMPCLWRRWCSIPLIICHLTSKILMYLCWKSSC